jgi:hypothetical protein
MQDEFDEAEFGDRRLTRRLSKLVADAVVEPAQSFPLAAGCSAALEATYRFLGNERVTAAKILECHRRRTVERATQAGVVLAVHDTTELRYSGPRDDLGSVSNHGHGLFAHVSLMVAADGSRDPLGVLGLQAESRVPRAKGERPPADEEQRESWRWWKGVEEVAACVDRAAQVVHVMDREGDSHRLFARMLAGAHRFIVRSRHDRRLDVAWPDTPFLRARMLIAEDLAIRRTSLSSRKPKHSRADSPHPPRSARVATLAISAARLPLRGVDQIGPHHGRRSESIELNVVRVHELETPEGCTPVEWILLTTEPTASLDDLRFVVDSYRARWVIEEFFKALKTGCAIEKRQLESKHALTNALAVYLPIAWQLLRLRNLGREDDPRPATEVLSELEIGILQAHPKSRLETGVPPTVAAAMLAVARLGGHIKNNGSPGWLVLGRGLEKLLHLKEGAMLRLPAM